MARRQPWLAALFLAPAFAFLIAFLYYPIVQTALFSLFNLVRTAEVTPERYVGLANYRTVLNDTQFWASLRFTAVFAGVSVVLEFWVGLAMALATFGVVRELRGPLRALIVVPWAIPPIIQAALWRWLYNSDVGAISVLWEAALPTDAPLFLASATWAVPSVIFAYVWKSAAVTSIFLMGGLALIPDELHEAAKVDGAGALTRLARITLPLLAPTIVVTLLFRTVDAVRAFDIVYGLTNGGPGTSTEILSAFTYKYYFSFSRFGLGSAYAMTTFALVAVFGALYLWRLAPALRLRAAQS